ncbi:uncharacterized protein EDB91DRAFT_1083370 [Suillus paluster]|uniref:uncharacterized protein n=1 Tax=Suillus paluster TaxID=48578 RepID=UPI001B875384|nr:uncharacterized protein EDB91DRAFT_1083370 [Suillus paluster]KAG1736404.1 hypothetical protein EDB91DRAFT_1083370 [Suillus paluster]
MTALMTIAIWAVLNIPLALSNPAKTRDIRKPPTFAVHGFRESCTMHIHSPGQTPMMGDETPLPSQKLDSNDRKVVLYNNNFGEGVTINIFSSNSTGSTVSKLERVTRAAQPATLERPSAIQLAPVEFGRDSVVFSGNTLHEHVAINIASPNSTGAESQTQLGGVDSDT